MKRPILLIAVASVAIAAAIVVQPYPVAAFEELDPAVSGLSCAYFSVDDLPASMSLGMDTDIRCFVNAPVGATNSAAVKTIVDAVRAYSYNGALVRYPGGFNMSAAVQAGTVAHGVLDVNGTTYAATNSLLPDGYLTWRHARGTSGSDSVEQIKPHMATLAYVFSSNAMACDSEGLGSATAPDVTGLPCYDGIGEGDDVWPASWPGQSTAPQPCTGATFTLTEDGVDLEPPLQGQTGLRGKTYQLTIELPTTGADDVWEMQFWPTVSQNIGRLNLPDFTIPATGTGVRRFDVTAAFLGLPEPAFDLGLVRVRCSNAVGVTYWTGETDTVAGNPIVQEPDPEEPEGAELAACFTLDGMKWDNPVTWVTGAGRMLLCLVEYMVVPDTGELAATFDEFQTELFAQFPFSLIALAVDFLDTLGGEMSSASGSGCFSFGGSWSFGDAGTVSADDVCIGDDVTVTSGQRGVLLAIIGAPMVFGLLRHAWGMVLGGSKREAET